MTAVELIAPATAPSSAIIMGVFDNRLFERSEAHDDEQRRKSAVEGVFYFGYFLLDKQKKVTRKSRESDELFNDTQREKLDWIPACLV